MTSFRLDNRRALITGASRGIGAGLARGLAEAGADLVLVARGQEALEKTQQELADTGQQVAACAFDVGQSDQLASFFNEVVEKHGPIDILVNNAGTSHREVAHKIPLQEWHRVVALNLTSVFALSQAFANHRIQRSEPGKIINIGSLLSHTARENNAPYAASKGGIYLLTKSLAVDWASHNISVNGIGPGYIDTPLTAPLRNDAKFNEWVLERCPAGRWGTPDDLVGAAVFLASPASNFVTGHMLYVDGGWLARF